MNRPQWVLGAALLSGCTFAPGEGFSTLTGATVSGDLETDALLLDDGRSVVLDRADLVVDRVVVEELASSGGGGSFDPAAPPEGFSLCHNGHCHYEDGSLWSYEEIEPWLAGDSASFTELFTLEHPDVDSPTWPTILQVVDLQQGPEATVLIDLDTELQTGELSRVRLEGMLVISGELETAEGEILQVVGNLPLGEGLTGNLGVSIDRDVPPVSRLELGWTLPEALLEGVDLSDADEDVQFEEDGTLSEAIVGNAREALLEVDLSEG